MDIEAEKQMLRTTMRNEGEFDIFVFLGHTLRFLGCDKAPAEESGAPALKCYYDCEPELVERQQAFRRMRKTERDSSYQSLSSLAPVVDFLERRIDVKFGQIFARGTVDRYDEDENCHHIAFDDGMEHWFTLDGDHSHAQLMLRDEEGSFSAVGAEMEMRIVVSGKLSRTPSFACIIDPDE
eukprot:CAMPEP_0115830828 /NCGR_PEP_ID=MMETSP0287-20121206/1819_1 /TAXON_ID=412157 /ORGANISM="Chrysochromulina rotalis, Strain UIO044" /LENGTH=180 /DNA_ID=CAMNT_0003284145 /DNA_START=42 /DNA_END=584 /DNA_ORIENTATION=+